MADEQFPDDAEPLDPPDQDMTELLIRAFTGMFQGTTAIIVDKGNGVTEIDFASDPSGEKDIPA